uniref:multidrug and toxin extrusion protein 1-like n=1 Tax=Pristiophorus japonicus TaxID=55135 RepID=UPI00398E7B88
MTDLEQVSLSAIPQTSGTWGDVFLRKIKGMIPVNFWVEVKALSRVAGPVLLTQLMVFLITIVSTIFCGHLGKVELDAVSLAGVVINVSGISVATGLSSVCDTLISQTYGSKNLKRIGVILQRGILILMIFCFPCWALFVNTEKILLAFKQPPEVAKLTNLYVRIFIPALPAIFLYQLEIKYLQNQGINMPQVFTGFIANIFNVAINYLLLYVLPLGVQGSAAANVVSQYCQAILLFLYIRWKKLHVETWAGWSIDCLQEWGLFIRLAIPSLLMVCIEWWAYEIGTILAGLISDVELGAQCVIYQILTVVYMIPLGFSVAASVHVGKALGGRNPEQAKSSANVALWCTGFCALVTFVTLVAIRNVVGYIFTTDKEIIRLVAALLPVIAANELFDSMACLNGGVLRGAGKQKLGALVNLVGFYLIGLPIGISLMFVANLGIMGFWYGISSCVVVQFVFYQTVICTINWNEASDQALVNAGVKKDVDTSHSAPGGQAEDISTEVDSRNLSIVTLGNNVDTEQLREACAAPGISVAAPGDLLSTKQLIIRRGLAFLSGPLILAVGLLIQNM